MIINFYLIFDHFSMTFLCANRIAASHLGLGCLPGGRKKSHRKKSHGKKSQEIKSQEKKSQL